MTGTLSVHSGSWKGARYQPYRVLLTALRTVALIVGSLRTVEAEEPVKSVSPT